MISINWGTRVIFVPKVDLTLVQLSPTEIYNMDLNWFRLQLKDLEDGEEGMPFPDTHRHNTEVSLGGLTFARVIEMINNYTLTFEDGFYAVNLVGANSNVADKVNVNSVSVRSANSAGLISSPAIEYSSYNGGVTIDIGSPFSGTIFPIGTPQMPVNNLADALLIRQFRGFSTFYIKSNMVIDSGGIYDDITFCGEGYTKTEIVIGAIASVVNCRFTNLHLSGIFDGDSYISNCEVGNISGFRGDVRDSILMGTCILASGGISNFIDCIDGIPGSGAPYMDLTYSTSFGVWGYNGGLKIINSTNPVTNVSLNISAGRVAIESSVTAGTYLVKGVGLCVDNSTGSAVVDVTGLISKDAVVEAINDSIGPQIEFASFDGEVHLDVNSTYSGIAFPNGTHIQPVNNLTDAKTIAFERGFSSIHVENELTVFSGENIDNLTFISDNWIKVTIEDGVSSINTVFEKLSLYGTLSGYWNIIIDCWIYTVTNFCGWVRGGSFEYMELSAGDPGAEFGSMSYFDSILPMYPGIPGVLLMNSNVTVSFTDAFDIYEIRSMVENTTLNFGLAEGTLILDSSCIGGTISVFGVGQLVNNSTLEVNDTGLISKAAIVEVISDTIGPEIEYSSYGNHVHINTSSTYSGIAFPVGTMQQPVNNLEDALLIAAERGFDTLYINSSMEIGGPFNVSDFIINGESHVNISIMISSEIQANNITINDCTVNGVLDNNTEINDCVVGDISHFNGHIHNSSLTGTITLGGGLPTYIRDCARLDMNTQPTIDMGGSGQNLVVPGYTGLLIIKNITGSSVKVGIGLIAGHIRLDSSTITGGLISVSGIGTLSDESGNNISSGVWHGATIINTLVDNSGGLTEEEHDKLLSLPDESAVGTIVTDAINEEIGPVLLRMLGLLQENQYLDNTVYTVYNGQKLLTSGRIRTYSNAGSVGTNNNVLATYQISSTWNNDEMQSYRVVKI
jgi:hypothetical protein